MLQTQLEEARQEASKFKALYEKNKGKAEEQLDTLRVSAVSVYIIIINEPGRGAQCVANSQVTNCRSGTDPRPCLVSMFCSQATRSTSAASRAVQ